MVSHSVFNLHFPNDVGHLSMALFAVYILPLKKCLFRSFFKIIYLLAVLSLCCCKWAISSCSEGQGYSLAVVLGLLVAGMGSSVQASAVVARGLRSRGPSQTRD